MASKFSHCFGIRLLLHVKESLAVLQGDNVTHLRQDYQEGTVVSEASPDDEQESDVPDEEDSFTSNAALDATQDSGDDNTQVSLHPPPHLFFGVHCHVLSFVFKIIISQELSFGGVLFLQEN